ncbi:MAG: methyltransferase domain-containing protein [Proteobacteria bacterium]|nr:methyltransferase domain-containing protein [Pseudomonadota bacterium]MBU1059218.1 methyltransferase domain-containing protein [Pseudomonadota bacterium]
MDIRQVSNKKKYDLAASCYDAIAFILSLGQVARLYREVSQRLDVPGGGSVVELGCGPASVIPDLLEKIDNSSEIIGIDFSSEMIALANRKKEVNGWKNVHFECMDMYDFTPVKQVDAVVFCLALTAMPDYKKAIEKAISILKPGGQLLLLDSIPLHSKWYHPLANAYTYFKSIVVGAKPTREIVRFIADKMTIVENKEMVFGVYTLINAKI